MEFYFDILPTNHSIFLNFFAKKIGALSRFQEYENEHLYALFTNFIVSMS